MAANLTTVSISARKGVKYGIYFFVAVMVLRVLFGFARQVYSALFPPPPPPPSVAFDVLPPIAFPDPDIEYPEITYSIETTNDSLPDFSGQTNDQMRVYFMPQRTADLFSFDRMKEIARAYGFSEEPIQINRTLYSFTNSELPSSMEIDIITQVFSLSYNLAIDSSPLNERPPNVSTGTTEARASLGAADLLPEDFQGEVTHEFLKVEGQNLVRALSLSDGQLVQINLHRSPIKYNEDDEDGYIVVEADVNKSNIWFIISGANEREKKLIAGEHRYFPIGYDQFETYPIKTSQDALEDLQSGNAYIANLGLNVDGEVTIRDIYLAYYDPERPNQFFQPVYVFEDESTGFRAYVPAVTDEYYGSQPEEAPEN